MYKEDFNLPAKVSERTFSPDLDGLIAFCAANPPEVEYCWASGECLLGQFGLACGLAKNEALSYLALANDHREMWRCMEDAVAWPRPSTYAAALDRARALREQHP